MSGDRAVARVTPFRQGEQHLDRPALVSGVAGAAMEGVGRGGGLERIGPFARADAGVELRIAEPAGGGDTVPSVDQQKVSLPILDHSDRWKACAFLLHPLGIFVDRPVVEALAREQFVVEGQRRDLDDLGFLRPSVVVGHFRLPFRATTNCLTAERSSAPRWSSTASACSPRSRKEASSFTISSSVSGEAAKAAVRRTSLLLPNCCSI